MAISSINTAKKSGYLHSRERNWALVTHKKLTQMDKIPTCRSETVKLLEENRKFHDIGLGKALSLTLKAEATKAGTNTGYEQQESFCIAEDAKVKTQPEKRENICKTYF